MVDDGKGRERADERVAEREAGRERRRPYLSPRIVKKRPVSRATLFSGSGPDTGGVVAQ